MNLWMKLKIKNFQPKIECEFNFSSVLTSECEFNWISMKPLIHLLKVGGEGGGLKPTKLPTKDSPEKKVRM